MKVSLIATTYNQPRDLDLYLSSVAAQTMHDFEVVVADDGSGEGTRKIVDKFANGALKGRFIHAWHPDDGYRKGKILNEAIRRSSGEWLVFTDSDLLLHRRFIEDHASQASEQALFMGRRVELGPQVSEWVRSHPERAGSPSFYARVLASEWRGETRNANRSFRIASGAIARLLKYDRVPDLLGSNFSIHRSLLERLNGFDEAREHYWGEDGDLFVRARNAGAKISGRKSFAVQWHLWHERRSPPLKAEEDYQRRVREDFTTVSCLRGLRG